MIDEKIKEIHSIKNEINKINNIINNNIIFSPINQKIKYKEDKNLETNSYNGTSECSQKTNIEKEIQINSNSIPSIPSIDNNSNILLNKEQLYETFILFQKFLSVSQNLSKESNNENYNNNLNKPLISAINNFKDIISNKEDIISNENKINDINCNNKLRLKEDNIQEIDNTSKEIKQFTLTSDKSAAENLSQNNPNAVCNTKNNIKNEDKRDKNYSSKNIPYINKTNLNDSQNNFEINLKNNNKNISEKEEIKNLSKKSKIKKISNLFISSSKLRNESQESIKEFKDINCSKIRPKNKKKNDSSNKNKKNISNDYSFDFSNNNNIDSYSASMEDSIKIMTNDLCNNKDSKKNNKNNRLDSIKILNNQNHNKTSKSNEINKIIHNLNNDAIQSAREIARIQNKDSFIKSYKNKEEELIKNIKKIKVVKSKRENNNNTKNNKKTDISSNYIEINLNTNINSKTNNNKEQIIEEKIKELNIETIKFREERDKVNKLKIEYEKLHEKLLKDIDNFNEKKEKFEKYRLDEINKIKEDKKNLDIQAKLITNIKMENQSLNNSIKSDKEIIDNLRNYINQLKSIIKKKDEEIKKLSQKNNNINNNYMINSYKTTGVSRDENNIKYKNINNKTKTFRNSILINNSSVERFERGYVTNLSCSKIRNKNSYNGNESKNNKNIINKSNSVVNIKNVLKMEARKGRNQTQANEENNVERLNSFSGNIPYSQIKINYSNVNTNNNNTSSNLQNLKIKLELLPKQTYDPKVKYVKKNCNKKIIKTNLNTNNNTNNNNNNVLKNNENKKCINKVINNNRYNNSIKISQELSKTSSNFMKAKKLHNKEDKNNKNNINKIEGQKPNKRSLSNDKLKLKLSKDLQKELNNPVNKKEYDFNIPEKYSKNNYKLFKKTKVEEKEIYLYSNNKKEIIYPSGLKKEVYIDGFQLIYFNNGDMKQIHPDGKNVYFFKDANTVQTTYPNGLQVFKFKNGQIEKHFPNGIKKIFFPSGAIDYLYDEKKEKDNFNTNNLKQMEI